MRLQKSKGEKWVKKITAKNLKTNTPIANREYLHNTDKAAMETLQKIPLFNTLCSKFIEAFGERSWNIDNMSSKIKITDKQCPRIYRMVEGISKKLGIDMPDLYIELNRDPNAYTYGNKKVFITVTSGLLECLDDDEIYAVLAHECGHIACDHVLYHTMGTMILSGGEYGLSFLERSLIAKLITTPLKLAFYNWIRCSEFSADRAAILCCEEAKPVVKTMMRLAGGTMYIDKEINVELFMEQAVGYNELVTQSKANKWMAYLKHHQDTHPLLSVRAKEATEWAKEKGYKSSVK